jgi:hypothetical protein
VQIDALVEKTPEPSRALKPTTPELRLLSWLLVEKTPEPSRALKPPPLFPLGADRESQHVEKTPEPSRALKRKGVGLAASDLPLGRKDPRALTGTETLQAFPERPHGSVGR